MRSSDQKPMMSLLFVFNTLQQPTVEMSTREHPASFNKQQKTKKGECLDAPTVRRARPGRRSKEGLGFHLQ